MKYLLRRYGAKALRRIASGKDREPVAHVWTGADTLCQMWTTGGIKKVERYEVTESPEGRAVCRMCREKAL